MSISNDEIIDKADEWKRRDFALKEEAIRLRHKRWLAVGKFFKWAIITIACLSALGGAGFGLHIQLKSCNEQKAIEEQIKQQEKAAYEQAWVKCVDLVSLEECAVIRDLSYEMGWKDCR